VLRIEAGFCLNNGHKKWHGTQLTAFEVLVYRGTISEPTPLGVSILLIHSFLIKNYQFSKARFKANASNILYEETQIYVFESKYNKKIQM
jgi:hypothetical protein